MSASLASPPKQFTVEVTTTSASYRIDQAPEGGLKHGAERRLYKNFRTLLSQTEEDIASLLRWEKGWDGYEAPEPKQASIDAACAWVRELYRDVRDALWIRPLVTADEEGDIVFEWWRGRKKLTVYVSPDTVEYVKVERRETGTEMTDGSIETPRKRRELWNWLLS
jgi:hypothetical protein